MRIAVGSDHAGYEEPGPYYKPEIAKRLEELGHQVVDCGPKGTGAVDYPDFANAVCDRILASQADRGILLCGTGIGMSMTANRHPGIRAAVCTSVEMARLSREHNDANVLCLGRRLLTLETCYEILETWLTEESSDHERHRRRVKKMG